MPIRIIQILCFLLLFTACQSEDDQPPKYWVWENYGAIDDFPAAMQHLREIGIGGILLSASPEGYREAIPVAKQYGIEVHAWQWIMNAREGDIFARHPEWASVNQLGHSLADSMAYVNYYKFMCPIIPEVRAYIYEHMDTLLAIDGLAGISLDYCRYVDVILPQQLWDSYGIIQDRVYPEWDYGYHPAMIDTFTQRYGYNPLELEEPSADTTWNNFRYEQVNEIAREIGRRTRAAGKIISASPFPTPRLAKKHVMQDWINWDLDLVFPMVYNGFYAEEGPEWLASLIEENEKSLKSLPTTHMTGLYYPGHRSDDFDIVKAMEIALDNGSQGISIFSYKGIKNEDWDRIKAFIENQ